MQWHLWPYPWHTSSNDPWVYDSEGKKVVRVPREVLADEFHRYLFAAAPEMLELLEEILPTLDPQSALFDDVERVIWKAKFNA